jgi:ribosome-associated heat shock protein Hsp15
MGRKQRLAVYGLADKHIAKADARALYEDLTPPPTPEEIELRKMARLTRPFLRPAGAGSPDKRERRQIRRMKEGS